MNKKVLLLALITYVSITSINAQITVRKDDVVEKPVFKPKQFDSLTNIVMQERPIDYKKYIGYKFFFLPKSSKYKSKYSSDNEEKVINSLFSKETIEITKSGKIPFEETTLAMIYGDPSRLKGAMLAKYKEKKAAYQSIDKEETNIYLPTFYHQRTDRGDGTIYGTIGTNPDSVYGKYFIILNIEAKAPHGSDEFQKLDDVEIEKDRIWQLELRFTLKDEKNGETLYWIVDQARHVGEPFFLVPYFEKQQSMFLNQKLVLRSKDRVNSSITNLVDVNTGEMVNIQYGQVWTCSDVTFIESKDSYYLKAFYFLKNGEKEVKFSLDGKVVPRYFMLESEFKKREEEKKQAEEERRKAEEERKKQAEAARIQYRKDCIAKWGQRNGGYIADGKVVLGMNKEMCSEAWGEPIYVNSTIVSGLTTQQWVYGWGTYLYFNNGKLTAIQN